jgi:signal transduction histidine kinase
MTHRYTLLVIDDTIDNLNVLIKILAAADLKVLIAQDGEEGIETANYALPDLILLDVMMPGGIDGFTVCERLKSQEKTREIPIIFMTALSETVDKVKGFELGAADYITKPIQHQEVLARVNAQLKIRHQQQQIQSQNEQLQDYAHELEKRNGELDAFAHTVAHDLKNPLGGIMRLNEILIKDCLVDSIEKPELIKLLQVTENAAQRAFDIVEALLLLAGVSRKEPPEIGALNMSNIIAKVIEQRLIGANNQEISVNIEQPTTWPIVQGYSPWVEEIWTNYISNALKYGGDPPQVALGFDIQKEEKIVRFWVRDNGKGLTMEEQAQLFIPFTRFHARVEGHGLGLSIVRKITEKLGGQVGVESELGQGSLFYFTLPITD